MYTRTVHFGRFVALLLEDCTLKLKGFDSSRSALLVLSVPSDRSGKFIDADDASLAWPRNGYEAS